MHQNPKTATTRPRPSQVRGAKDMDKNIAQFRGPKTQGNIIWSEHQKREEVNTNTSTVKENHRRKVTRIIAVSHIQQREHLVETVAA